MFKMEKSFGLYFHLKKSKVQNDLELPVYLRITVNGTYCEISTKRKWSQLKWNIAAGRADGKTDDAKSLNAYLEVLHRKVYEVRKELLANDKPVTAENIKIILQGGELSEHKHMLMDTFKNHNDQTATLVGKEFSRATLVRYITSFGHTRSFLQWKYKVSDIDIAKLDYEFISEYEFWLKSVRNCGHNSTIKYLNNFRKIVNRCLRNGWLHKDPFLGFRMTKKEVERTPLTEFEIEAIKNKPFSFERLDVVRNIFLFSCYTGLAYADVKKLKRSEIIIGVDGQKWLYSHRQKTETPTRIPLLPIPLSMIEKYADHPQCKLNDRVLPVLSNQKMNSYLKEIADCCGIYKKLTYHIARHTFATTVTLSNGVPIETVSKLLGHRDLRTTQHYAKIMDKKICDDLQKLRDKLSH